MTLHQERTYRNRAQSRGLFSFRIVVKETDLWISAGLELEKEARDLVFECRRRIEGYILDHPEFRDTLLPFNDDPFAPSPVREMIASGQKAGVGPMASVAGAVAQFVGEGLLSHTDSVIVENGGDIFMKSARSVTVSVLAGESPLSGKLGLVISKEEMPSGVCSSSGTVGHSLSFGISDVVCLVSGSAYLSDAAATALGNDISSPGDMEYLAERARAIEGIRGGIAIFRDRMTAWGDIEIVGL